MLSIVSEPLAHGASGEGCDVLQRSCLGGCGCHYNGILHGVILLERLDKLCDGRSFLTNGDVHAVEFLAFIGCGIVEPTLVEDGIEDDGGLSSLTISNDQLTLPSTDWNHCVDSLQSSLDRLIDGPPGKNTGRFGLGTSGLFRIDGPLAINGVTERINNASQQLWSHGYFDL